MTGWMDEWIDGLSSEILSFSGLTLPFIFHVKFGSRKIIYEFCAVSAA